MSALVQVAAINGALVQVAAIISALVPVSYTHLTLPTNREV